MITSPKKDMDSEATDTFSKDIKKPNARYPPHVSNIQYPLPSQLPPHPLPSQLPTHAPAWPVDNGLQLFNPYVGVWRPRFGSLSPVGGGSFLTPGWNNSTQMEATANRALRQARMPETVYSGIKKVSSNDSEDIPSRKPAFSDADPSDEKYLGESARHKLYIDRVKDWDVLCGRGGKSNHHPGNKIYRQVVGEMKMKYKGTKGKKAKTEMSRAIVDHVFSYGGRFVKKEDTTGRYYMLSPPEAQKKTSQALREAKDIKFSMGDMCGAGTENVHWSP